MLGKMKIALYVILIALLCVAISEYASTHTNQGQLHVTVHAAAGVNGHGQDIFGEYTEYWTFGSTALSTPTRVHGDNLYIGSCDQTIVVPGAPFFNHTYYFQGEQFFTKVLRGSWKDYTARNNTSSASCIQESVVFYNDANGRRRRLDHDHSADVTIPPGGSRVNEPWP